MTLEDLSANSQDYLKMIWDLQEWDPRPVQPSALAKKANVKLSTVSGAITRLTAAGLVEHEPYGGVVLSDLGRQYAVKMVRRHRLIETFLVQTLGYGWDEVHDEAERLEHAVSDDLVERVDVLLDHPDRDPHGDSIPLADGCLPLRDDSIPLSEAPDGALVKVERVSDEDSEMLRYLQSERVSVGTRLLVCSQSPYSEAVSVRLVKEFSWPVDESSLINKSSTTSSDMQTSLIFGPVVASRIRVCIVQ
ncbi:transcriptional regulator [Bombiscardovia apis]|uniref:Manganese transport regulator n=1 Tax=Bombiscardovia apis TaxID=2932182 RepID=A0ABM8BB12_9BIFI|nr:metal-dependent transcriptional regulator [Bombiscardovia apis]BDR54104.1 transcriptional regulator [Bombiscardovia apis]